jgi:PAS domain S-box-containing protein
MSTNCAITPSPNITAHQYEQLMADMDSILWEADAQPFQYTYVSEHAERFFGYPVVQWAQPNFWLDHLHPADRDRAFDAYHRAITEKRNHRLEYRMMTADGRIVWLRDSVSVIMADNCVSKMYGIMTDITERKQAEEARQDHLRFLESMDKINRAIQGTMDFEQMLRDVFDATLKIFACDRAWLLYPCDPTAPTWSVPIVHPQSEYATSFIARGDTSVDEDMANVLRLALTSNGPVQFGPGATYPLPAAPASQHKIQSAIVIAIYPKMDKPYLFGLHQCTSPRLWTPQEERLFLAIGRRLVDALNSLLSYRHLQESERRYREIFDNSSDVIAITEVTTDGRFKLLDVNPALSKMLGFNQQQLIGNFLEDLAQLHEGVRTMLEEHRRCLAQQGPVTVEREWDSFTGRWDVHMTLIPVSNDAGQIYRIVGMGRNLTAQKRAEDRLRVFLDHATDAFFLHDASGIILDVNRRACEMLGYSREELIGLSPDVFDPTLDPQAAVDMNRRLTAGETIIAESRHRRKDGSVYPIELRVRPVWQNGQQFNVSLVQDITERKRVESELRASEARFRTFVDHATDGFFLQAVGGRIVDINRQACESLGYSREELIGQLPSFFDPDWTPAFVVSLRQRLDAGEIVTFESRHRRKDGSIFSVEVHVRSFTLDGRTFGLGLVRDITKRKQAAAALQESEERYRTLYEANPTMYFTVDAAGTVLSVNRFGAEQLGYTVAELTSHSVNTIAKMREKRSFRVR